MCNTKPTLETNVYPSSHATDPPSGTSAEPTRRQRIIGAVLVMITNCLWVASAELSQYIYRENGANYTKPFTLSFVSQSMFSVFLLGFMKKSWQDIWNLETHPDGFTPPPLPSSADTPIATAPFPINYVFRLALILTPIYIMSSWTYNSSIWLTTVASSSIISTMTSLFTLALGAMSGVERFSYYKCSLACLSITGVAIILSVDHQNLKEGRQYLAGDALSLISAFIYAVFSVVIKSRAGPEGAVKMTMVFSFVGCISLLVGWPSIFVVDRLGVEKFEIPSLRVSALLAVNAFIGAVIPTILYAITIVMTTPLTSTLSVSLMVPFSITWDWLAGKKKFTIPYFIGAILVIIGFVAVNFTASQEDSEGYGDEYFPVEEP